MRKLVECGCCVLIENPLLSCWLLQEVAGIVGSDKGLSLELLVHSTAALRPGLRLAKGRLSAGDEKLLAAARGAERIATRKEQFLCTGAQANASLPPKRYEPCLKTSCETAVGRAPGGPLPGVEARDR